MLDDPFRLQAQVTGHQHDVIQRLLILIEEANDAGIERDLAFIPDVLNSPDKGELLFLLRRMRLPLVGQLCQLDSFLV